MLFSAMIHILYGADSFSVREALDRLKVSFSGDGTFGSNLTALDGRKVTSEELLSICNTVPFLAEKRLVVVEGLLQRFQTGRRRARRRRRSESEQGNSLGPWNGLPDSLRAVPDSTFLALVDGEVHDDNILLKPLRAVAKVRQFRLPRHRDLPRWIQGRAEERDLDLTPRAVHLLAKMIGTDLWTMASEIDKLAAYANGERLDEGNVHDLVAVAQEVNIFSLVDAIVEGRLVAAIKLLGETTYRGGDSRYVFNMIVRQYRSLVLARELLDEGASESDIGRELNVRSRFALEKLMGQARRTGWSVLRATYFRLVSADASVKRGIHSADLSLTLLVYDLASLSRSAGRASVNRGL